jgi:hypothetical protein
MAAFMVAVPLIAAGGNGIGFSLRLSSRRIVFQGQSVVFAVRMQTGGSAETAAIGLTQGGWPDRAVSGSPIAISDETLSGPGRITGGFASAGASVNPFELLCSRGADRNDGGGVDVLLPANSTSTLSYKMRLAARTWPGIRPTIGAYAYVPAVDPTGGGVTRELGTEQLAPAGTTGIRVMLSTPEARPGPRSSYPTVSSGQTVLIAGMTDPLLADTEIRLAAESYLGRQFATIRTTRIGTTRTNSAGRFRLAWTPSKRGTYVIRADLPHPPPPYRPDRGCDLTITAR